MKRLLPFLLLVGCSAPRSAAGTGRFRIETTGDAMEIRCLKGADWRPLLRVRTTGTVALDASGPALRWATRGPVDVDVFGRKTAALFPGLEFLEADERSSEGRRRPPPSMITVPLMAFEVDGALVALLWSGPAAPCFEAGERNRMSLEDVGSAVLLVEDGATIVESIPRWISTFGLPAPEPWPRTVEEELALCKAGFAAVAAPRGKHRAAVGKEWTADWTPGFGVLLHLLGEPVDWFDYSDLLSAVNCRILRWEAPFHAGQPEVATKLVERMKILADMRKRADGEWGFHPTTAAERTLGPAGESVLGTSAYNALSIVKAARMTGDPELKAVALDVLGRLRRHRVPRGGRTGECPLYQPDLLAAAFAVGAYVEAWKLSGDAAWLQDAARWAKAGLPFVYLRGDPDRKGMLYASVPVFGTTGFTRPWFGVPAQWTGLVYAYFLRKLGPHEKSVDWLRVADGITASGVHQQYADGPSKGCLPAAFTDQCTRRAPPDLNPEPLLVNVLTSLGKDPDPDLRVTIPASQKR